MTPTLMRKLLELDFQRLTESVMEAFNNEWAHHGADMPADRGIGGVLATPSDPFEIRIRIEIARKERPRGEWLTKT